MHWLYRIPAPFIGVAIIGGSILISCLGFRILRPWVKKYPHPGNEVVYSFMAATGVIYAVVLGLFAAAAWDSLKTHERNATNESLQIRELYSDLLGFPSADRERLQPLVKEYMQHVIREEQQQRKGVHPTPQPPELRALTAGLMRTEPVTEEQKLIYAEALKQFNEMVALRHARTESMHIRLPWPLWAVVVMGAVLTIGVSYYIVTESPAVHLGMVVSLAVMIGLMIFAIVVLDHPVWGSISADSYQEVLDSLNP